MTEVEVRNFQSVEHSIFRIEGFTALVGRSNIGKSALVRAIKAALTGTTGTSFVRHGPNCARRIKDAKACKCVASVRIKRDGFDLLWEKGDGVNRYTFNGKVYDSIGSGTPSFLMDGYAPIKIGDSKDLLQVSDQFDPIFLLNQTGGVIADVLSDVAHLDRVNIAMRMAEKDRKEAVSIRKVREQDVVVLTQNLVQYDGLDDDVRKLREVENKLHEVERADKRVNQIEHFLEVGSARATEVRHLAGVENIPEPDVTPLKDGSGGFLTIQGWHDRLVAFKVRFDHMKGVDAIKVPDVAHLKESITGFDGVTVLASRYNDLTGDVTKLETVQTSAPETPPANALQERLTMFGKLDDLEGRYLALVTKLPVWEAQHQKAQEDGVAIQGEWVSLGVCPTCAQPCGGHAEAGSAC